MGATSAVSGVLGMANIVGGQQKAKAERRAANAQAKTQATATRASLLTQRQQLIDQASLQEMQLQANQALTKQQAQLASLDIQQQEQQQKALLEANALQQQMGLVEGRFNNEASLANAIIGNNNTKSQANASRVNADLQALQAAEQGKQLTQGVANQAEQEALQVQEGLRKLGVGVQDALAQQGAQGYSSQAQRNALTNATREGVTTSVDNLRRGALSTDLAKQQAEYMNQVAGILRGMGISEADAQEAAAMAQLALAEGGYDLNNLNLDFASRAMQNDNNIARTALDANVSNARAAQDINNQASNFSNASALTANANALNSSLQQVENQARANTFQLQQAPSLLSQAMQIGTGAYNTYQTINSQRTPQLPKTTPQEEFGISRVKLPSLLSYQ